MEVNQINKFLKNEYKNINLKEILGISFSREDDISRIISMFKKGYWSLIPFSYEDYNMHTIKMCPNKKIINSPVVYYNRPNPIIHSPEFQFYFIFQSLSFIDSEDIIELIKSEWKELKEKSVPFQEYTSNDDYNYFENYIFSDKALNNVNDVDLGYEKTYIDFWNHYNNTPQQKAYFRDMVKMEEDEDFLPELNNIDYGIWNTRMYNAIGQRAYSCLHLSFEDKELYFWKYLTQIHGYHSVSIDFSLLPEPTSPTNRNIRGILDKFDQELNPVLSKEVLDHPLYETIQRFRKGGGSMAYFEAAKFLDLEHNDPYAAWDALVTASYWAGNSGSKAIEPIWEAAIYLSGKENWKEINEVLIQQYEFYNYYKDKV